MSKKAQSIIWLIVAIIVFILIGGVAYGIVRYSTQEVKNPEVTFEIEGYGNVKMVLYPEYAPNTVKNFIKLAQSGYYTGKVVYGKDEVSEYWGRNSEGNVENPKLSTIDSSIEADSDSDHEYEINGEFVTNDFKQNTLSHKKGIVSMVRADYTKQVKNLTTQSYNSANSQFTILTQDAKDLNGLYAAFGEVTEGMDIVEKIYATATKTSEEDSKSSSSDYNATSITAFEAMPVIKNVTVETYGVDYGMPETHEAFNYSQYLYKLMSQYYSNGNN